MDSWFKCIKSFLKGAVAAYNFGTRNVRTAANIDGGTTGGDYSGDVMERAKRIRQRLQQK